MRPQSFRFFAKTWNESICSQRCHKLSIQIKFGWFWSKNIFKFWWFEIWQCDRISSQTRQGFLQESFFVFWWELMLYNLEEVIKHVFIMIPCKFMAILIVEFQDYIGRCLLKSEWIQSNFNIFLNGILPSRQKVGNFLKVKFFISDIFEPTLFWFPRASIAKAKPAQFDVKSPNFLIF